MQGTPCGSARGNTYRSSVFVVDGFSANCCYIHFSLQRPCAREYGLRCRTSLLSLLVLHQGFLLTVSLSSFKYLLGLLNTKQQPDGPLMSLTISEAGNAVV